MSISSLFRPSLIPNIFLVRMMTSISMDVVEPKFVDFAFIYPQNVEILSLFSWANEPLCILISIAVSNRVIGHVIWSFVRFDCWISTHLSSQQQTSKQIFHVLTDQCTDIRKRGLWQREGSIWILLDTIFISPCSWFPQFGKGIFTQWQLNCYFLHPLS